MRICNEVNNKCYKCELLLDDNTFISCELCNISWCSDCDKKKSGRKQKYEIDKICCTTCRGKEVTRIKYHLNKEKMIEKVMDRYNKNKEKDPEFLKKQNKKNRENYWKRKEKQNKNNITIHITE